MSWHHLTLVTDADIGEIEPAATHPDGTWGASTWPVARSRAKNLLKIWIERDHQDIVGASDRIRDRWEPDRVWGFTGSAFTDITTEAVDDVQEDVALATILATAATDRLYVGARYSFHGLFVRLLDSVNSVSSVMTMNYWKGGAGWTSLGATDGTVSSGATLATTGRVTWPIPTDWHRRDLNGVGVDYYWVELVISVALTAGTAATQVLPIRAPVALSEVALLLTLYYITNGLALSAADPEQWSTKATSYLDMAKELYGQIQVPMDVDLSGAITPETERVEAVAGRVRMLRG